MSRRSTAARSVATLLTAGAAVTLAGCTSTAPPAASSGGGASAAAGGPITVQATDTACEISVVEAPAGTITFNVTNSGNKVTEFYLYGDGRPDHGRGREHRPGPHPPADRRGPRRRHLHDRLQARHDRRRHPRAVHRHRLGRPLGGRRTPSSPRPPPATSATSTSQIDALVPKTQEFVDAVKAGDVDQAKALFPVARTYWERIEPVAESFGDLDPKIDGREDDERRPGRGVHRLPPAREGPVGRRAAGRLGPDRRPADGRRQGPGVAGHDGRAHPASSWRTAPRSCSTRSPPARSPARRTATRTPTSGTSRPTSRARRPRSPRCAR